MNLAEIQKATKAEVRPGVEDRVINELLIDSRKIINPSRAMFIAIKGSHRDGHEFIADAYKKGVRTFLVSSDTQDMYPDAIFLQVQDTLTALHQLAATHRNQFHFPVIGITGSNGKTIVKEWLNQLLDEQYSIIRSPRSYNSQIGVPLSVWPMNETHELGIFEAGISQSGEMDRLQKIIQPTIGIFTNIGEAHSEGFLNQRQKVNEKLRLFTHVKTLVYCKDAPGINEGVASLWQQFNKGGQGSFEIFNWSTVTEATLQVLTIFKEEGTTLINALYKEQTIAIRIPFTDDASVENAIHCWCVLLHLGVTDKDIARRMLQLGPVAMRLELKKGMNNCSIINDSYSADLSSFNIALDFLAQQSQHDRKTVILSDILQSGRNEKELYKEVAQSLAQRGIARLIGIGDKMVQHQASFRQSPIPELVFYPSVEAFMHDFHHLTFRDETILLKGARIFELEQIDRLLEQKVHQTVLEIDLNALAHNLRQYQQLLKPSTKLMAMVKAFSYGSGSYEIANALQFHKVDYLAVAYADEGVELRRGGINLPIMVMNADPSTFDVLIQYNLEPDLYSPGLLKAFEAFLKSQGIRQFPVHIELETGMNRLGFSPDELNSVLDVIKSDLFTVKSVFSHLAASEDPQHDAFTQQQAGIFHRMVKQLEQVITYPFLRHIDNTAGIARHPELQLDMVRLGIGLYGIDSANTHRLELKEVSTLIATIAQIKHLKAGETVSYGRRGVVSQDTLVATVRIGYADGYPRNLSNGIGKMWVKGKLAPVIGTVCMDMVMIDITGIPHVQEGDDVILFGRELPVEQVAHWAQTIPYEMLTGISQRVKRVYFEE